MSIKYALGQGNKRNLALLILNLHNVLYYVFVTLSKIVYNMWRDYVICNEVDQLFR
jgi:hypothetical protein